ncbi:MAG: hypothetical protein WAM70_10480, partial [Pyrinomonadaceae bacterium]
MNLTSQLTALRDESRDLTLPERAELACRLAKRLEKLGEYEQAREALREFWAEQFTASALDGLTEAATAEVLLRVGVLTGSLGSAAQVPNSQETSKDLITRSIELLERLGEQEKVAEARGDLALCYWREGSYDEARITLQKALDGINDGELKAMLLIRAGIIEERTQRLHNALQFYNGAAPLLERSQDHALRGALHNEYGLVFRRLAAPEDHGDYLDRALLEYTAASFHFEEAGNTRYLARVENNLGFLKFTIGRYQDAHRHLDRARDLFLQLKDVGTAAQVDETRARTLLAEGSLKNAERTIRAAVRVLEKGGQQAVLAEALTTQGIIAARTGNQARAALLLQRAIVVAETVGD